MEIEPGFEESPLTRNPPLQLLVQRGAAVARRGAALEPRVFENLCRSWPVQLVMLKHPGKEVGGLGLILEGRVFVADGGRPKLLPHLSLFTARLCMEEAGRWERKTSNEEPECKHTK